MPSTFSKENSLKIGINIENYELSFLQMRIFPEKYSMQSTWKFMIIFLLLFQSGGSPLAQNRILYKSIIL